MVEDIARASSGPERSETAPVEPSPMPDFRMQAVMEAFGPRKSESTSGCCDKSDRSLGMLDFAPPQQKTLAAAFGDMLASAGYDQLFSARGEGDPQDRKTRREERRKEREERGGPIRDLLGGLFQQIKGIDLGKMDLNSLADKLKLAPEMIDKAKTVAQALQGVESVKFSKTDDGKLGVNITRKDENTVDINKEHAGPPKVTVKNANIGKEVSFKIGKDGDSYKLEDITGIKINSSMEIPKLLGGGNKDVAVDLKSAKLDKDKEGNAIIKAEITNPIIPGTKIPVDVPLNPDAKKK